MITNLLALVICFSATQLTASDKVATAKKVYETRLQAINAEADKARQQELNKYLKVLLAEQVVLTKAGRLDEALAVRTEAEKLTAGFLRFGGHRYKLFTEKVSWTEAKARCERLGGYLACITSKEEDNAVKAILPEKYEVVFLGGQLTGKKWTWLSGEPFAYAAWAPTQPDGKLIKGQRQNRIAYWRGGWADCLDKDPMATGYICEWDH